MHVGPGPAMLCLDLNNVQLLLQTPRPLAGWGLSHLLEGGVSGELPACGVG